mmetsp:Transcript_21300/g.35006  ORF Transcript_21300/g.35006 Transcript_21300/m.35006 type:complete len:162 (+) Transcript_21300:285-770(+)
MTIDSKRASRVGSRHGSALSSYTSTFESEGRNSSGQRGSNESNKETDHEEWVECFDENTKTFYFFNIKTEEASWIRPQHYKPYNRSALLAAGIRPDSRKASWVSFTDANSGLPYFYNNETGETRWDPPTPNPELMKGHASQTGKAIYDSSSSSPEKPRQAA